MKTKTQQLLEEFNKAFARNNMDFILSNVTDHITWTAIGDFTVKGRTAFQETLKRMAGDEPYELTIHRVITHGKDAAVHGVMNSREGKQYAFCDVYELSGFKNPKITAMTSFVIPISHE
ncbi:MAG TPA: nuclear transport factor 2 family protein [Balneolaceae bacterium]|nr:nuclear transport factor 2 family protein [Balneolaceae bacterium]